MPVLLPTLDHLLILLFAGAGVTYILVNSFIFGPIRNLIANLRPIKIGPIDLNSYLVELINCPTCIGFWVGALLEILIRLTGASSLFANDVYSTLLSIFLAGAMVSCSSTISHRLSTR